MEREKQSPENTVLLDPGPVQSSDKGQQIAHCLVSVGFLKPGVVDFQCVHIQLCPTFCNPVRLPVHRISQARILGWVTISFSRGPSRPRD